VDDAMYVVLAKSIATGQGYRSLNLPGAPVNTHFPPGYPAMLALLWRLAPEFPANLTLFRAFNVLCLAVAAVASSRFLALRGLARPWAIGVGAVVAVSVPLLVLGTVLLSEPLFLALLLLALPLLERFADDDERATSLSRALLIGLIVGALTLVRSHAIVLAPALVIALGARRRWRDAALVAVAAIACILPWQLYMARHSGTLPAPLLGGYDSYTAWWLRGLRTMGWRMVPLTLERTVPETTQMFAILFSPARGALSHGITLAALAGLALLGATTNWRRVPVTLLFIAGYLAIVAIWPFQTGRFVWGIWPLLLGLFALGARAAMSLGESWRSPALLAAAAACCWVAFGYAAYETRAIRGRWWGSIPRSAAARIDFSVGWTRANTPANAVLATEDEGPVYLYTGRRTVPVRSFTVAQYLDTENTEQMAAEGLRPILATYPVHAVLASTKAANDVARLLSEEPGARLVFAGSYPGGSAYMVRPK
jgi:hypothetical protein